MNKKIIDADVLIAKIKDATFMPDIENISTIQTIREIGFKTAIDFVIHTINELATNIEPQKILKNNDGFGEWYDYNDFTEEHIQDNLWEVKIETNGITHIFDEVYLDNGKVLCHNREPEEFEKAFPSYKILKIREYLGK